MRNKYNPEPLVRLQQSNQAKMTKRTKLTPKPVPVTENGDIQGDIPAMGLGAQLRYVTEAWVEGPTGHIIRVPVYHRTALKVVLEGDIDGDFRDKFLDKMSLIRPKQD